MNQILNLLRKIYDHKKYLIIFIFFSSILCSLIFLSFFKDIGPSQHSVPGSDYLGVYEPMAYNILQGKGITLDGRIHTNIAPGFPVIISGILVLSQIIGIDKLDLMVILNIFLTAVGCCFLFLIAKEIFNKKIALISSLLWMSYPFNLWLIKNPNTEEPFIPLFFLGILLYVLALKRKKLGLAFFGGIVLGLSFLVRVIILFFPFILVLLVFFFLKNEPKRIKFLLSTFLLIGILVSILPWITYAYSQTRGFMQLSSWGPVSVVFGITFIAAPGEGGDQVVLSDDVSALIERVKTEDLSSVDKVLKFFTQELINRPVPLLKLIGLKLARSWYATSQQWWEDKILKVQLLYLITGLGGLLYAIKNARDKLRDIIFLLSVILYFWAITFVTVSIMRYMIPVMGLIIIFSAILLDAVMEKSFRKIKPH